MNRFLILVALCYLFCRSVDSISQDSTLPVFVDNSAQKWFPPVRNQGPLGSCIPFSRIYYTTTYLVNRKLDRDGTSPTDNTTKLSPKLICNSFREERGSPTWAEYPYDGNTTQLPTNASIWRSALQNRLLTDQKDYDELDTSAGRARLKRALFEGQILNFNSPIEGWRYLPLKNNPATNSDDRFVGQNSAVFVENLPSPYTLAVVGYHDEVWTDINNNNIVDNGELGAFKIVNSQGPNWVNQGFAWVSYDSLQQFSLVRGANRNVTSATTTIIKATASFLPTNATPILVAEVDVQTANRQDLVLYGGLGSTNASSGDFIFTDLTGPTSPFGRFGYDGTTAQSSASLAFDWSKLPTDGKSRRYALQAQDRFRSGPHRITGFRLRSGAGRLLGSATTGTKPAGGFPLVADSSQGNQFVYAWIDVTIPDGGKPGAITDLAVVSANGTRVVLSFSATGDDAYAGYAVDYEIRYSTNPITTSNLGSATAIVFTPTDRVLAGTKLTSAPIDGLQPGQLYYFVIRGRDDARTFSSLSNQVSLVSPLPLSIVSPVSLPPARVGVPYNVTLMASGAREQYQWTQVPNWTETTATGGVIYPGARWNTTRWATYYLPFTFPVISGRGLLAVNSIQILPSFAAVSIPNAIAQTGYIGSNYIFTGSNFISRTAPNEGIFINSTNSRVSILWKGRTSSTQQAGAVEVQISLFANGTVVFTYGGAVNQSGFRESGPGSPAITDPFVIPSTWTSVYVRGNGITIPATGISRWTPTRLPSGLTLNETTGVLSGTPKTAGTYTISLRVRDSGVPRQAAVRNFTLVVQPKI